MTSLKQWLLSISVSFVFVLIITLSMVLRYERYTEFDRYIAYLFAPAVQLIGTLHLLADPVVGFWAVTVGSLLIYAVAVWLVLSTWIWLRARRFR